MNRSKTFYGGTALSYEDLLESDRRTRIELEYYKVRETNDDIRVLEDSDTYGVEIIKKEYDTKDEFIVEKSELHNLTTNETFAEHILEILKINKVTPVTLDDVMCDLIRNQE